LKVLERVLVLFHLGGGPSDRGMEWWYNLFVDAR